MHKQIGHLLLINSFFVFAISLFAPLYAIYVGKISATIVHVGSIWGVFIFSTGILTYFVSKYENNLRYADYFLISGFLLRAIGWTGYILATYVWHLYLIQIIFALGEAFGTPSYNALFSKYLDKGKFATEWGFHTVINSFMIGTAAFAGAIIVQNFGFTTLFILMIVLSLVSTVIAFIYRKLLEAG